MIEVSGSQGWTRGLADPLTLVFLGGALVTLLFRRRLPHGSAWVAFVFCLSAAAAVESNRFRMLTATPPQHVAGLCAFLSFFWSVATAITAARRPKHARPVDSPAVTFVFLGRLSAVLFGVVAASIQMIVLVMRMIYVGVDIVHGYPWQGTREYGFGPLGLGSLGLLFASCAVSLFSTRAHRLATVQLWTAVMLTLWGCLLYPPFRMNPFGGFERTGGTLLLLSGLSVVFTAAIVIEEWFALARSRTIAPAASPAEAPRPYEAPGFAASCGVLAIVIIVLVCYHLLVPVESTWGGIRGSMLLVSLSAAVAAGGAFLLWSRSWSENLGDAALGTASLSLCGLAMLGIPSQPTSLAERYPMMFNAMIVGLAVSTGLWTWLSCVWGRRDGGVFFGTTAARLIPQAQRFAFLSAALALVAGALMTYWPRLPSIASMDHSLGRVTAGLGAHLFLVLVMLWSSRRLQKLTFHLLTVLSVVSTAGFVIIRMIPFASRLG